ncbi:hypothetical protein INT44_002990 [Umbelopsis vinacea]|uniref:Uncharacterized protein n=1 Tax=Umbelopsis vinacea TaxID=44442 RepID=A0A8H7Q5A0_9FUNG|nr:hypothetical protein INT44_002990 [Umbelopsis vinacea]
MGTTSEAEIESAPEYAQNPAISLANKKRKTPQPKNRRHLQSWPEDTATKEQKTLQIWPEDTCNQSQSSNQPTIELTYIQDTATSD